MIGNPTRDLPRDAISGGMKLLVFSHTPPSPHAERAIAKLMQAQGEPGPVGDPTVDGPDWLLDCYHVDCGQSEKITSARSFRCTDAWFVIRACAEATWRRVRFGIRHLYYVPAPGKRPALYRDWIVMLFCRGLFPHVIFDWQRTGLGDWLEQEATWFERWVTHRLLEHPELSISLDVLQMRDALWFVSRDNCIIPEAANLASAVPIGTTRDSPLSSG